MLQSVYYALRFEMTNNMIILMDKTKEDQHDPQPPIPPIIPLPQPIMDEKIMADYAPPSFTRVHLSITRPVMTLST